MQGIVKSINTAYGIRMKRRRFLYEAFACRNDLDLLYDNSHRLSKQDILLFSTIRNEMDRLPYFLSHYRQLGINHFFFVDNGSDDGTIEFLSSQRDSTVWTTKSSYKKSRFGINWMNWLQMKYGNGHWCLTVDADEIFVYSNCDTKDIHALTSWLDSQDRTAFGALLVDMFPRGRLSETKHLPGDDPFQQLKWFDAGEFITERQQPLKNLWVRGGIRARTFFNQNMQKSPTLNKIPLLKRHWRQVYVNSTHSLLPPKMNLFYDGPGGKEPAGVLLHSKFLKNVIAKSEEEKIRKQHFNRAGDFESYYDQIIADPVLWHEDAVEYNDWQDLIAAKMMTHSV